MFCTKCGSVIPDSDRFCRVCGAPSGQNGVSYGNYQRSPGPVNMAGYNQPRPYQGFQAPPPQRKKSHGAAIAISITSVLVLAVVGYILFTNVFIPKPVEIVDKFVEAVNDKDINKAVSCLDPKYEMLYKGLSNVVSNITGVNFGDLADMMPALMQLYGNNNMYGADFKIHIVDVLGEQIDGDNATVRVAMSAEVYNGPGNSQNENINATVYLKKFSGKGWRIVNLMQY